MTMSLVQNISQAYCNTSSSEYFKGNMQPTTPSVRIDMAMDILTVF